MKNYVISYREQLNKYLMNESTLELTEDYNKAIYYTQLEGQNKVAELNKKLTKPTFDLIRFIPDDKTPPINVDDLNGMTEAQMVIITKTIENPDIIQFSADCDKFIKAQNPEAMIFYGVSTNLIQTPQGTALVFIAVCQYWGTPDELEAYKIELRRKNLLIKP